MELFCLSSMTNKINNKGESLSACVCMFVTPSHRLVIWRIQRINKINYTNGITSVTFIPGKL